MAELGACQSFVWELQRSGLIERGQLDNLVGEFLKRNPRAEPAALAEYLIAQEQLTKFQAERILDGKTQGLVLERYVLMDVIGSGSMGQVYKALSKTDNQWYAVKVLPRRSMWNVRLARRQVRAFSQFSHVAVVPFVDVGTSGGLHYLVWPLVEGETLESLVQRQGSLSPEQTALIGMQIASGLNICHQHGLFHGLLKPSNVMIGSDNQARILDFGIGSLLVENEGESLVDTMSTANTLTSGLDCASPESIMEPTNRTPAGDQYSLGCVLYFCLSGRYPFPEGSAVEKMMAHQFKQPTPLKELAPHAPEELIMVIEKLMQKSPESRYGGADEVVEALQPFAGDAAAAVGGSPKPSSLSAAAPGKPTLGATPGLGLGAKPAMPASAQVPGLAVPGAMPRPAVPTPAAMPTPTAPAVVPGVPGMMGAPGGPVLPSRASVAGSVPGLVLPGQPNLGGMPGMPGVMPNPAAASSFQPIRESQVPGNVPEADAGGGLNPILLLVIAALLGGGVYFLFTEVLK